MATQIYSVDSVKLESQPDGNIKVTAHGRVNTSGWKDITLVPSKEHIDPHTIGLDLVGTSPGDVMVTDQVSPVEASIVVDRAGKSGVTVFSANDSVNRKFPSGST